MCMTGVKEVSIPEVRAFKLFTRCDKGKLRTAFSPSNKSELFYEPNERIAIDSEDSTFFAFAEKKQAIGFASRARRNWTSDRGTQMYWNIKPGLVIVLPVTMFKVVKEGKFHVPSGDIQCMDGYYPAFESKEILVHDTQETRNDFHDEILTRFFKSQSYSMPAIVKEAIKTRLPHVAQHIG